MKRVVIFGRAKGVWDELADAQRLCAFDTTIAVGSAGVDYPGVFDVWVSFHTLLFEHWRNLRRHRGRPLPGEFWSNTYRGHAIAERRRDGRRPHLLKQPYTVTYIECDGGSSGLIAAIGAVEVLGADKVVLCGVPMVPEAGQYDTDKPWDEALKHRVAWLTQLPRIEGRVRSMSGWTQTVLGTPTAGWLGDARAA